MSPTRSEDQGCRYPIADTVAPSRATYLAVAEAKGRDPLDLPPLANEIDPDALDALLDTATGTEGPSSTFEYAGCSVTVTAEEVRITDC